MSTYSVAEAMEKFEELIGRALNGEEIVIERDGQPVAEIMAIPAVQPGAALRMRTLVASEASRSRAHALNRLGNAGPANARRGLARLCGAANAREQRLARLLAEAALEIVAFGAAWRGAERVARIGADEPVEELLPLHVAGVAQSERLEMARHEAGKAQPGC